MNKQARRGSRMRLLDPQQVLTGDYVTLTQACKTLKVGDPRTLHNWIRQLQIKTFASPTDRRSIMIHTDDLTKLSKISDRSLPRTESSSEVIASLERELTELRVRFERMVEDYEGQLTEQQTSCAHLVETYERQIADLRAQLLTRQQ